VCKATGEEPKICTRLRYWTERSMNGKLIQKISHSIQYIFSISPSVNIFTPGHFAKKFWQTVAQDRSGAGFLSKRKTLQ
jgi:hypothetical protein